MLPFGDDFFNDLKNTSVLTASVEYILSKNILMFPYIKIDTYLFVYMQFIFSFLSRHCYYIYVFLVLYFLFLRLLTLDYFVNELVLLGFSFCSCYVYFCMFHQTAKICSKS